MTGWDVTAATGDSVPVIPTSLIKTGGVDGGYDSDTAGPAHTCIDGSDLTPLPELREMRVLKKQFFEFSRLQSSNVIMMTLCDPSTLVLFKVMWRWEVKPNSQCEGWLHHGQVTTSPLDPVQANNHKDVHAHRQSRVAN